MKICYVILVGLFIGGYQIDAVTIKEQQLSDEAQIIAEAVKKALDGHQADVKTDDTAPKEADKTDAVAIKKKELPDEAQIIAKAVKEALDGHQADVKTDDAAHKEVDKTDAVAIKKMVLDKEAEIIAEAVEEALHGHQADVKTDDGDSEDDDEMKMSDDVALAALEKELEIADDEDLFDDTQDEADDAVKQKAKFLFWRRRSRRRRWFTDWVLYWAKKLGYRLCCKRLGFKYCCDRARKK